MSASPDAADFLPVPAGPVDESGRIRVGRYAGALDIVRWGYPDGWLAGQFKRALGRKRWFQAGVFDDKRVILVRVIDHGLFGTGIVWVAELDTGRTTLEHRLLGIPLANLVVGPFAGRGADAHVTLPNARLRLGRDPSSTAWHLTAHVPGHALSIELDTRNAPTPVMLVGEPRTGDGVLVQRFVGLEARGTVRVRSEVMSLGPKAQGFLEYGNGFFPRPLAWSTALVAGPPWAFVSDLPTFDVAGQPGSGENTLWDGALPKLLASAHLEGSADTRDPWQVSTSDGALALAFYPRCILTETSGLGSVVSAGSLASQGLGRTMRHAVVAGRFEGTLRTASGVQQVERWGLCEARAFGT